MLKKLILNYHYQRRLWGKRLGLYVEGMVIPFKNVDVFNHIKWITYSFLLITCVHIL